MSHTVSCSLDPRNEKSDSCQCCDSAKAVEGILCEECAIQLAVDDCEYETAHEIAESHGLSREHVERAIRESEARTSTIRREMNDAMRAA